MNTAEKNSLVMPSNFLVKLNMSCSLLLTFVVLFKLCCFVEIMKVSKQLLRAFPSKQNKSCSCDVFNCKALWKKTNCSDDITNKMGNVIQLASMIKVQFLFTNRPLLFKERITLSSG